MNGAAARARHRWMDLLRGTALVLLMIFHSSAVPARHGISDPDWVADVNDFLTPFRMPTLMFLSGMLLATSLSKQLAEYYSGKLRNIAWPYVVWVAITFAIWDYGLDPLNPRSWIAALHLWFLFYVFIYYAIAPLLRRLPAWAPPLLFLAVSFAVQEGRGHTLAYFAVFFFAGNAATVYSRQFERLVGRTAMVVAFAVAGLSVGVASVVIGTRNDPRFLPLSLCGVLLLVVVARRLDQQRWTAGLQSIGRNSIVYYVAHFPVMTVVAMVAVRTRLDSPYLVAVLNLGAALAISWLLVRARSSWPITNRLFEGPRRLLPRSRPRAAAEAP